MTAQAPTVVASRSPWVDALAIVMLAILALAVLGAVSCAGMFVLGSVAMDNARQDMAADTFRPDTAWLVSSPLTVHGQPGTPARVLTPPLGLYVVAHDEGDWARVQVTEQGKPMREGRVALSSLLASDAEAYSPERAASVLAP